MNEPVREEFTPEDIKNGRLDERLAELYEEFDLKRQRERYAATAGRFREKFGSFPLYFFSSPGRTELGGNHTDHNHGRVLAASIHLDLIAALIPAGGAKTPSGGDIVATEEDIVPAEGDIVATEEAIVAAEEKVVKIYTEDLSGVVEVDLSSLAPREAEKESTAALVRGIAAYFAERNYGIGGFTAYLSSEVAIGSGLSSSASFEVLIGEIFNYLFNGNGIGTVEIARAGQWAENTYFGKPCGLMDQIACAHGGVVAIDFADPASPDIDGLDFSFSELGYRLCILDTGGSHADLTGDYASIPREMGCVAQFFSAETLRKVSIDDFLSSIAELRRKCGDRAVLRALHFYREHGRAGSMADALREGDIDSYLDSVSASGSSSWRFLQNCIPVGALTGEEAGHDQGLALALGLSEDFLEGKGAQRVQGGGFAGTIQVYIPADRVEAYRQKMEHVFGEGALTELYIRARGVTVVTPEPRE